jgi:hypothetical protein
VATRLYLRDLTSSNAPTAGEKSAALPVGTFKGNSGTVESLSLSTTKGNSDVSTSITSLAQTAHQDGYIARFTSDPLTAQTIPAQSWTCAIKCQESNASANAFFVLSLYIWRPSTSSVVGYIYDSDTALSTEWPTTAAGRVFTISGAAITTQNNDVLVLEVWYHATQGQSQSYTNRIYYNGATDVTSGGTGGGSYIESPATLSFVVSPTRGRISWAETEVPFVPTRARLSWAEAEIPFVPTRARISWAETEVPAAPTRGWVSWAETEVPFVPTRARLSWAETEVPPAPTRGRISWAEAEVPFAATRARASWAETQVPFVETRGRLSWAEFQVPTESYQTVLHSRTWPWIRS